MESVVEKVGRSGTSKNGHNFEVWCQAGPTGALHADAESLWVHIGQRVLRKGAEEIWQSVAIYAKEEERGDLTIRILVFNPDWDEPLQIASITSRPRDAECRTPIGCDLNHVSG